MQRSKGKSLQFSVELLDTILQNAADGITVQNVEGKIIYANKVAAKLSGYTSVKTFINSSSRNFIQKFHVQDENGKPFPRERLPGRRVINGEPYAEAIVRFYYPRGKKEQWSQIKSTPIFHQDTQEPQFAINIFHDITQEKKAEKDRETFFAVASHDLKSLLTSIKAYAQLLQKRFIRSGDTKSYNFLYRLDGQVDKLTLLIIDLLDLSRIKAGKLQLMKEVFDLNLLVQEIVTDMQLTTTQTLSVQGKITKNVSADKGRLTQVIINFISNAIKYAPESKKIMVELQQKQNEAIVKVRDFGKGISQKDQKRIFELFYQSAQKKQSQEGGLGIGLFIAKAIIVRHKGKIGVKSVLRKGSTFFFHIPLEEK